MATDEITVVSPPSTTDVTQQALAMMAALTGVLTDYNQGSQVRTMTESFGAVVEQQGIGAQTLALQAIAISALTLFQITPAGAVPAQGTVTFSTGTGSNLPPATQSVQIPQGTVVQTAGGVQFATTENATLQSGGTSITVNVQAVIGGSTGNVATGAIVQIVSGLSYPLVVSNTSPTAGGVDAQSASQGLSTLAAKISSLIAGSPVAIANGVIGVVASGSQETVQYATCYDDETEILTENGWYRFADLPRGLRLATLNPETHVLEYQNATHYHAYDYVGALVTVENKFLDLAVTPDHHMYVRSRGGRDWKFAEARHLRANHQIKRDCLWTGEEINEIDIGGHKIPMDLWLEFLGYFISEGCAGAYHGVRKSASPAHRIKAGDPLVSYSIQIRQHDPAVRAKIKACLDRLPFTIFEHGTALQIRSRALAEALIPLGKAPEKYLPDYVKTLSRRQLSILMEALILGDGHDGRDSDHGHYLVYFTSSRRLADDVQEIALKAGFSSSVTQDNRIGRAVVINGRGMTGHTRHVGYRVSIHREHRTVCAGRIGRRRYAGKVYCVTVPNHIVYVRRNGKCCWNGQCYEPWVAAGTGAGSGTAGFTLYVDNGAGTASDALLAAVKIAVDGNQSTDEDGLRPAGVPYVIDAVEPVYADVFVVGTVNSLANTAVVSGSTVTAVQSYFSGLQFGDPAEQSQLAALVSNAAIGAITSLTVTLAYASASGTAVTEVTGLEYNRIILNNLSVNLTSG